MRYILFFVIILCLNFEALALKKREWLFILEIHGDVNQPIPQNRYSDQYIDINNIRFDNGLVYWWELYNSWEPMLSDWDGDHNSVIVSKKADCEAMKFMYNKFFIYSGRWGTGNSKPIIPNKFEGNWVEDLDHFSKDYQTLDMVCNRSIAR